MSKCHEIKTGKETHISWWWNFPSFEMSYTKCGYFNGHPEIHLSLLFISIVIQLPWINHDWTDECDPPRWGIAIHNNTLWIYKGGKGNMKGGGKWWTWDIPFFSQNFYKHDIRKKDGTWFEVTKMNWRDRDKLFDCNYDGHFGEGISRGAKHPTNESGLEWYEYDYTDSYDQTVIHCYFWIERREWRRKWLGWTSLFNFTRTQIEIEFAEELGSEKGSWKGGVMGCSYDLYPNEDPIDCIKRMERNRKF